MFKKWTIFLSISFIAGILYGCGSILPDKFIYPNDMKSEDMRKDNISDEEIGFSNEKKPEKQQTVAVNKDYSDEEANDPVEAGDTTLFGEQSENNTTPAKEEKKSYINYKHTDPNAIPRPIANRKKKKHEFKNVVPSDKGYNALSKTYNMPFDKLWDEILEIMLSLPIENIDKNSGIILSGYTENMTGLEAAATQINPFSDGSRLVRYKYTVKLYDYGDSSEVVVIPFAQVSKNRRWHEGKPAVEITKKLMRIIVRRLGD